jgi:hypothetical protein
MRMSPSTAAGRRPGQVGRLRNASSSSTDANRSGRVSFAVLIAAVHPGDEDMLEAEHDEIKSDAESGDEQHRRTWPAYRGRLHWIIR